MAIIHDGRKLPFMLDKVNPVDVDWFYGCWQDLLVTDQNIVSSSWKIPAGFSINTARTNVTVYIHNVEYPKTNGVLLSTTLTEGQYEVLNTVITSQGRELPRGFKIELGNI